MKKINIAIDGPAASGKTTLGLALSKRLGFCFLDTGLMYRAFTYFCLKNKIDFMNKTEIKTKLNDFSLDFNDGELFINNNKINKNNLSNKDIINNINKISELKFVREKMNILQCKLSEKKGYILVGRDIGTVIMPDAELKIFLDANVEKRANRRLIQTNKSENSDQSRILKDLIKRDNSDLNREFGALKKAHDAILIDNTNLSLEETVNKILSLLKEKGFYNV